MTNHSDFDPINPSHYKDGAIECIEAQESCVSLEGFHAHLKLTIIGYLWRYEKKNGLEDLLKAQWYLRRLVVSVDANSSQCKDGFCPMPGVRHDTPNETPEAPMFDPVHG